MGHAAWPFLPCGRREGPQSPRTGQWRRVLHRDGRRFRPRRDLSCFRGVARRRGCSRHCRQAAGDSCPRRQAPKAHVDALQGSGQRAAPVRLSTPGRAAAPQRRALGDQPHLTALPRGRIDRPQTQGTPQADRHAGPDPGRGAGQCPAVAGSCPCSTRLRAPGPGAERRRRHHSGRCRRTRPVNTLKRASMPPSRAASRRMPPELRGRRGRRTSVAAHSRRAPPSRCGRKAAPAARR